FSFFFFFFFFFFSSRRRHTRSDRDWSSDVCSSDLRGLVMVIMALDHVREFFHLDARLFEPTDLTRTTPLLFLTRWITHLCAPSFVFLAGTGAYLWASRGRSQAELTRFLVSRGLWLVVVELSLVTVGWTFNFTWSAIGLQVICAIGWSMVVLA